MEENEYLAKKLKNLLNASAAADMTVAQYVRQVLDDDEYIVVFVPTYDGEIERIYPVNTDKEIARAAKALGRAGFDEATIYRGHGVAQTKTSMIIQAR